MEFIQGLIQEFIYKEIRPRVRVDGGDIKLEKVVDNFIFVGVYAECSTCPCCENELALWIEKEIEQETGMRFQLIIHKYIPYYAK
jgi:Fe-S cluster biogenesis protein NfuA